MTRNSELRLEDLHECDHTPETPIESNGEIIYWLCRCAQYRYYRKNQEESAVESANENKTRRTPEQED